MRNTNSSLNLNTNEIIHQIRYLVKYKHNYTLAANFFLDNHLSIELLNNEVIKLSKMDLAKLSETILESRNIKK